MKIFPICLGIAVSYSVSAQQFTGAANDKILYEGRVGVDEPSVVKIYWAGSSVSIRFKGTGLKAMLKDERGSNYYNVIIDGDSVHLLRPDTSKKLYDLVSG